VPSKLYPLLAAGRPILAVAPPGADAARIVRRAECGIMADPDNPEALAEAVRKVLREPELLREMSARARQIAVAYDKVRQIQAFANVLEEVAN